MGRLWAKMPVKLTLHLAQRNSHEEHVKNLTDKIASKVVLENIFALTQRLIDVYPDAISAALPPDTGPPPACDIQDCTHSLELPPPPGLNEIEKQIAGQDKAPKADLTLASVLASCHARLLDLLDCFFLLVTSCLRLTVASPDGRDPEFSGPEMRVGSFVPPKAAAISMQICLLKHLMVGLSGRLASLGAAVSSRAGGLDGDGDGMQAQIVILQHQMLTKRHSSCLGHVSTIEDFLMRFDTN
ncbi:putative transcription factor aceii [Diaporthe ampelina]|uniref:Putative transcription factor aceii n=1 Tax=Diaporthe ampelina TaxID=1214573 RepID=A0A0G2FD00_9PEZI|nr:putative transcription factor aceii [Diaporthe ampelina]